MPPRSPHRAVNVHRQPEDMRVPLASLVSMLVVVLPAGSASPIAGLSSFLRHSVRAPLQSPLHAAYHAAGRMACFLLSYMLNFLLAMLPDLDEVTSVRRGPALSTTVE